MKVLETIKPYIVPLFCAAALAVSGFMLFESRRGGDTPHDEAVPIISVPQMRSTSVGKMLKIPVVTRNPNAKIIWDTIPKRGVGFDVEMLERQFIFNAQFPGLYSIIVSTDGATELGICQISVPGIEPDPIPDDDKKKTIPPPPPAVKKKLILAVVYDHKNPPLPLAALMNNKALADKLSAAGHEFKTYDKNSRDIQDNGLASIITTKGVALPALVTMWADGDRGRVVTTVQCPSTEMEFLKAVSDAGGF
jgi:hypothetical protein